LSGFKGGLNGAFRGMNGFWCGISTEIGAGMALQGLDVVAT
jgi:hypothetical protein